MDPADELRRARRRLTIAGLFSLFGGAVAIVLPNVASMATAIFIGWRLIFSSRPYVVDALSVRQETHGGETADGGRVG